jgi:signal transduction histidine kinase
VPRGYHRSRPNRRPGEEEEVSEPPSDGPEVDRVVLLRERQFERLLTRLPQGVVVLNKRLGVEYANPAARRLLGGGNVRVGEPLRDPWPDPSLRELGASLFTSKPAIGRHLVPDGERTISVECLQDTHGPTVALLLEDVTQRERGRRAERRFVENAAHELLTPVSAIASAVDVLEGGAAEDADARAQFLGHIRVQSERLRRLSTSLLTLARFESGEERVRLDLVPAKLLLEDVASDLRPIEGVELELEAPAELAVLADRDLLHHALGNVAINAVQHTHEGRIALVARDVGLSAEIEISDSGSGMSAHDVEHAFDRFYRSSTPKSAGFGLGLAIARDAVHAMDGTMSVESGPGGTTVRIWLPSVRLTH